MNKFLRISYIFMCLASSFFLIGCGGGEGGGTTGAQIDSTAGYSDKIFLKDSQNIQTTSKMVGFSNEYTTSVTSYNGAPAFLSSPVNRSISDSASGVLGGSIYNLSATIQLYNKGGVPNDNINSPYDLSRFTLLFSGSWGAYSINTDTRFNDIMTSAYVQNQYWNFSSSVNYNATYAYGAHRVTESTNMNINAMLDLRDRSQNRVTKTGSAVFTGTDGWSIEVTFSPAGFNGIVKYHGIPEGSIAGDQNSITLTDYESNESQVVSL